MPYRREDGHDDGLDRVHFGRPGGGGNGAGRAAARPIHGGRRFARRVRIPEPAGGTGEVRGSGWKHERRLGAAAATALGSGPAMSPTIATDVAVVGGGGAGLMAAATAAALGGDLGVLLLERDAGEPCNSLIASSFIPAAGSRLQRAAGIADSPEEMATDILRKNGRRSDPEVTLELCRRSAEAIHWLIDGIGVDLELAPEVAWIGHSHPRMHSHPTRSGIPIIERMREFLVSLPNASLLDRARGTGLVRDRTGSVTGVTARRHGAEVRIAARRVVLATGGFNANREMLARYIPEMADAPNIGARSSRGDGIAWGMEAGAAVDHMSGYQGRDCIFDDGTRLTPGVINEGGITVNATGRRFTSEDRDYSELAAVYRAQPGGFAVAVWDARIQRMTANMHVMREAMRKGGIAQCRRVADLAERFGLPAGALAETIDGYNAGVRSGVDAYARRSLTEPLAPPFLGARITGAMAHTQGGLRVDTACRVLRPDGRPVPNLYAGGNTMAGLSGDTAGGYTSGNGLLVAYASGMIIGRHVAASIERER